MDELARRYTVPLKLPFHKNIQMEWHPGVDEVPGAWVVVDTTTRHELGRGYSPIEAEAAAADWVIRAYFAKY